MLRKFGALLPVSSLLLTSCVGTSEPDGTDFRAMGLTAFTRDESFNVQMKFLQYFNAMLRNDACWFLRRLGISERSHWVTFDKTGHLLKVFRQLVKELVENVATHAQGVGYTMLELNQEAGMSIFVGDTGLLARGIHNLERCEAMRAVSINESEESD